MRKIYSRPEGLTKTLMRYCPGCGHGIVHRIIAELLVELNIRERTVGIAPVGCAVFADEYFNCDMIQPAHGRGPAVATGLKRVNPDLIVFSYQGDGDLAAIGTAEIVHAAARNENFTVIFINNAIYGMTGGQLAPTTLPNMQSTTTPTGRDIKLAGNPIRVCELINGVNGPRYINRTSIHTPQWVLKTKKAIKRGFEIQIAHKGFSLIEVLSTCPTNWRMGPVESIHWIEKVMSKYYELKLFRDLEKEEQ